MTSNKDIAENAPSFDDGTAPLVSIILRTKDRPALLPRAVESVRAQHHTNWHLHVVNDGGNPSIFDDSIRPFRPDERIKTTNVACSTGMEAASNLALASAAGEYIAIHDDDDTWHPQFLVRTLETFERRTGRNLVGVVTNCEIVKERIEDLKALEVGREAWDHKQFFLFEDLFPANLYPPICLLAKTDAVRRCGAFNAYMNVLGDWDFNIRLLSVGDIECIEDVLAFYHWRVATDDRSVYGNTITQRTAEHEQTAALYRNDRIRAFLDDTPSGDGLLHALLPRLARIEQLLVKQQNRWWEMPDDVVRRIATEVWFERQRWGVAGKIKDRLRRVLGLISTN